ncbi:hypothetical protein AMTRI_Chr01g130910 [Amborella trichopoda]
MPGQLLSLRVLKGSASATTAVPFLKPHCTSGSLPTVSIFTRLFPYKLKYVSIFSNPTHLERYKHVATKPIYKSGFHQFSTRSSRERPSCFSRGPTASIHRDSGFRSAKLGQSKSLVEDEAELSDWISDLKTDSLKLGLSDSDSDMDSSFSKKNHRDSSDDGLKKRQKNGNLGNGVFSRKRFDKDSDDDVFEKQRGTRDSLGGSLSKKRSDRGFEGRGSRGGPNGGSFLKKRDDLSLNEKMRDFGGLARGSLSRKRFNSDSKEGEGFVKSKSRGSYSKYGQGRQDGFLQQREIGVGRERPRMIEDEDEDEGEDEDDEDSGSDDAWISEEEGEGEGEGGVGALTGGGLKWKLAEENNERGGGLQPKLAEENSEHSDSYLRKDVLAKARTGTGKTVAFLLPAIELIVKQPPVDRDERRPPINVLVICPTRELASQAAAEADKLLKYHPHIGVQVVIGGTRLPLEQKRLQANPCQILVATPGRLRDHIENTSGFSSRLLGVKVLVLDEADHLLDMGFRRDIERIIASVPKQRQTLLFSATVPEEVRQICHIALRRDHEFINTVEEGSEETHSQVRQAHLVAPLDKHFPILYCLLKEHIAEDVDYKVLVFCTTAMVTRLVAELLSELKLNVREIHSRKTQSYRTRVSDEFRKSKGLILVTSDVSARGVDYPDVTLVIQMGLPSDREQYIHRLGRTGRKGKEGKGLLLLAPWEEYFLSIIKDLPITKALVPMVDPDTKKQYSLSNVCIKTKFTNTYKECFPVLWDNLLMLFVD